jgi:hypothetical protein
MKGVSRRLAAARATGSPFGDHGFDGDNRGWNGHDAGLAWPGP